MVDETLIVETAEPAPAAGTSYLEWGPVFGGAAVALAITVVLVQFGSGVGLSVGDNPMIDESRVSWNVLVAGLWVVFVALASSSAAGYLAARMRSRFYDASQDESEFRDGAHGLVAWAVSTVVAVVALAILSALSAAGAGEAASAELGEEAANFAANIATIFNFASAAGAALGAAAAWFGAQAGGTHRNEGTSIGGIVPAWARRRTP